MFPRQLLGNPLSFAVIRRQNNNIPINSDVKMTGDKAFGANKTTIMNTYILIVAPSLKSSSHSRPGMRSYGI